MENWYKLSTEAAASRLKTDPHKGLSEAEAKKRLESYGLNQLREKKPTLVWVVFFEQFKDFMIVVLLVAAVVAGAIGELNDSIMILIIVFLNAVLGTTQQYRAERAIMALKKLTVPKALVVRGGETKKIDSIELVPGDIVLLEAGAYIPADIRIIDAPNLKIDESALTGESIPVEKLSEVIQGDNLPVADQANLAFAGTIATYGRGKGVVVETGMATQVGKIAELIEE